MKHRKEHIWHYLMYGVIFGSGLTLVYMTRNNANVQAMFVVMTAILYFMWAMIHHYVHHDLHLRVVIEYILIVILGTLLSLFLFSV
jgi:hypothetical protein